MKISQDQLERIHDEYVVAPLVDLSSHPTIKGYNFEQSFDFHKFLASFSTTGFQATHFSKAMEIVKSMMRENATITLGFTGNMISSGVREVIKYLVKHNHVHMLVTNAGGVEEDIMKCLGDFKLGDFRVPGKLLFDKGVNRTGNIFVTNDLYAHLDKFMARFLERLYKEKKVWDVVSFNRELGKEINHEDSVLYWAYKNNIPIFCPAITDGAIGDLIYFFKHKHEDFIIDVTNDTLEITTRALNAEKTGLIILGAGVVKHYILNAHIFREGADYSIMINTATEYDGSDSGADPEEAITWGKIHHAGTHVKVHGDATILFPLLVAGVFKN